MQVVGTETAFEVLARVAEEERKGRKIISFCIGEPDFPTPEAVKEAGIEAIRRNETHYSPSAGIWPLREAVAAYITETRGVRAEPEEVVITPGAKPIIFHSLLAVAGPGDEVIYPNPGFPIYESVIRLVGATPVPLPLREEAGFSFTPDDLAARVNERTAMVILNSPHNPTGSVVSQEALKSWSGWPAGTISGFSVTRCTAAFCTTGSTGRRTRCLGPRSGPFFSMGSPRPTP